jgi:hypothetical protein
MLKRKGTLVSVGNASGAVPPFAPLKLSASCAAPRAPPAPPSHHTRC